MDDTTEKADAEVNNLPDSAFLYVESGGEKDEGGKTIPRSLRHLPYKTSSGSVDLPRLHNALSRLGQRDTGKVGGEKWLTESVRETLQKKAQKVLENNTDAESGDTSKKEQHDPSWIERIARMIAHTDTVIANEKNSASKEGRRNSTADQSTIQQIHDLSTKAGADCPMMVMKDASGKSRWVLISTNAYEDRDGEYVSRKAQKRDVERMNEEKSFGPLRLWHLGYPDVERKEAGPGVDIGDCDYSQMFGKFRVESGTFRNERIAAAIKERADKWATSVGFFHPQDEPDPSGTYHEIYTFERSLLPRTKASNYLTPLAAILKEFEMTTKEEKVKQLTDLLGDEKTAKEVLGQVDTMEKQAQARGLTYKQADAATAEKGDKKDGDGDEDEEDDLTDMDEGSQKAYKAMLPHILKAVHTLTKKSNIVGPSKKELKAAKKERKAQREAIEALTKQIAELKGDLPRGIAGGAYRPSQTGENLITLAGVPTLKENVPDPLGDFMAGMGMAKFDPTNPNGQK